MTALTANLQSTEFREGWQVEPPVKGSEIIYKGSPVFLNSSGYAYSPDGTTNTLTAGDVFLGYAYEKADNSSGSDGTIKCHVVSRGLVKVPLDGSPTQAKTGRLVYVNNTSDDATATLTADYDSQNCPVGIFTEYVDSSYGIISLDGFAGMRVGYGVRGEVPTEEGARGLRVIKANYSFAVDGGAVGSITLATIPSGVIILAGVVDVTTALTSSASGAMALELEGSNDLVSSAAVSGAPWSTTGRKALVSNANFGTASVKTTTSRTLKATIATGALTAGVFDVYLLVANY